MNVNIFVRNMCFVYCRGCYSYSREEKCNKLLETDKIIDFLKYAHTKGISKVTLCGGDPLTRKDILHLIKEIKNIGMSISIDTLGTPFIRDVKVNNDIINRIAIEEISELVDCVGIPIDGSKNEIIRLFRPTKNDLLNEQISICKKLIDNKVNVCINTVVHKENLTDAKALTEVINKLGNISKWQVFQYAPLGKYGLKNRKFFEISDKQFEEFQADVLSTSIFPEKIEFKKSKNRVNHYLLIDNSGNAWVPGFEKIIADFEGNVNSDRLIIGNICNCNDREKICEYVKKFKSKSGGEIK